jgi:hypothetical protein
VAGAAGRTTADVDADLGKAADTGKLVETDAVFRTELSLVHV